MIIVDKPRLKFLLAGRNITITVKRTPKRRYRVGHLYTVGANHKNALCRAEILKATEIPEGWELELRYLPLEAKGRYLRAGAPHVPICTGCKRGIPDERELLANGLDTNRCPHCGRKRPKERDDDHGYTTSPAAGARHAGQSLDAEEQAKMTAEARARDRTRANDPMQRERDEIARSLERMRDHLQQNPNRLLSKEVRAMEHRLLAMDRKLKAA